MVKYSIHFFSLKCSINVSVRCFFGPKGVANLRIFILAVEYGTCGLTKSWSLVGELYGPDIRLECAVMVSPYFCFVHLKLFTQSSKCKPFQRSKSPVYGTGERGPNV